MKKQCQDEDNGGCTKEAEYLLTIERVKNKVQHVFCAKHALQLVHGKLAILEDQHEQESDHIVLIPLTQLI